MKRLAANELLMILILSLFPTQIFAEIPSTATRKKNDTFQYKCPKELNIALFQSIQYSAFDADTNSLFVPVYTGDNSETNKPRYVKIKCIYNQYTENNDLFSQAYRLNPEVLFNTVDKILNWTDQIFTWDNQNPNNIARRQAIIKNLEAIAIDLRPYSFEFPEKDVIERIPQISYDIDLETSGFTIHSVQYFQPQQDDSKHIVAIIDQSTLEWTPSAAIQLSSLWASDPYKQFSSYLSMAVMQEEEKKKYEARKKEEEIKKDIEKNYPITRGTRGN